MVPLFCVSAVDAVSDPRSSIKSTGLVVPSNSCSSEFSTYQMIKKSAAVSDSPVAIEAN